MKLKYMRAYGFYQCENCKKPYAAKFIEDCMENQYTPYPNYCMNCGAHWDVIQSTERGDER